MEISLLFGGQVSGVASPSEMEFLLASVQDRKQSVANISWNVWNNRTKVNVNAFRDAFTENQTKSPSEQNKLLYLGIILSRTGSTLAKPVHKDICRWSSGWFVIWCSLFFSGKGLTLVQ